MKYLTCVFFTMLALGLYGAALAQVSLDVSQPVADQTYTSPVPVIASASSPAGITGWEVYLDSNLVFKNNDTSGNLNTSIAASIGTHTVVVKAWDSAGDNTAATDTISVVSGPAVTLVQPANGATVPSDFTLQANCSAPTTITGWEVYIDSQTPPYFKNASNSSTVSVPVTTTTGPHNINVKCWDAQGAFGEINFSITAEANHPTVQLLGPSQNATVQSPFTLQASCSSPAAAISGWEVYVDGQNPPFFKNTANSSSLDVPVSAGTGPHSIVVKCWDVNGDNGQANLSVTVQPGGLIPTPPSNARPFTGIDDLAGWGNCSTSNCTRVPPSSFTFNNTTADPSLDGNGITASASGPPFWGILFYKHLGAQDSATHFLVEWNFRLSAGADPQALEFDFPVWIGGQSFYFGTQCALKTGFWQYWMPGNPGGSWHNVPQVTCATMQTGVWHKLRWYGTRNASSITYVAMELDGKQFDVNIAVPKGGTSFPDNFTVQFQIDGNSNGTSYTEYLDELNAWVW
jgi:hypothetical protein